MEAQYENAVELTSKEEESHNLLQGFFLARLQDFVFLSQEPALVHWERELVKRATYSAYLDCLRAGLAGEARAVLQGVNLPASDSLVVRN